MDTLEKLVIGPRDNARASVIWLHGLGADGNDFEPIVPQLGMPEDVRFVFPHAPVRPVTINGGMPMRAWYDISMSGSNFLEDEADIRESQHHLERLIENEVSLGIPSERIVLAGFSQGGAIVLHTGLRHQARLGGIMALSTYLPLSEKLAGERSTASKDTPVFMAHGQLDQMVPMEAGARSRDHLISLNYSVSWHEYPIEHNVSLDEIGDIATWLQQVLAE